MKMSYLYTSSVLIRMKYAICVLFIFTMLLPVQTACNLETWECHGTEYTHYREWTVRPTWFHAVPAQTDARWWETADGSDVRNLNFLDTIYIAVPQDMWHRARKFEKIWIGDMPAKVVDKLNRRYNGHDRIDILLPNGGKLTYSDSITLKIQ